MVGRGLERRVVRGSCRHDDERMPRLPKIAGGALKCQETEASHIIPSADVPADRDKSYKEDHIMRLHEIADPNDYRLTDTEPTDVAEQIERIERRKAAEDAKLHPMMPMKTKRMVLPETD
jgi:hypothetical protein